MVQLLYQMIKNLVYVTIVFSVFLFGCHSNTSDNQEQEETKNISVDSLDILTNLIKQDSANHNLFAKRARLHLKRGRIDPAFRDLSYAIDINPNDPDLFILLGDIYFITGKKENCLSSYRKAGALDPKSLTPVLKLAETHLILKEYETANQFIDIALNMDVNNAKAYYLRGIQSMETRDTVNALLNLQIAGNIDTNYYEAFMQIGSLYNALNDTLAIAYYNLALKVIPNDEQAMFLLAFSYQEKGEFDKALNYYQKLTALYPTNALAYYNTGYINMVEIMDFEAAKDAFRQAILLDPAYVEAVYNLGRIYEETDEYNLARKQYMQALELETNYPLAIEGLNRLDDLQISN